MTNSSNFPTTAGAFQPILSGPADAFVTKLDPGGAVVYSTCFGGTAGETASGIGVDSAGNAYVVGRTNSSDFPTTPAAFQPIFGGGIGDVFVTKLNPSGSALVYSSYLGGSDFESGFGIAVDAAGSAYVTGRTGSSDFPTTAGAFQATQPMWFGRSAADAFIAKIVDLVQ